MTNATYDALGHTLTQSYGNGVTTISTYHPLSSRLTAIAATWPQGAVFSRAYSYDTIGNVQTITAGSEILRYSYDDRDRLTRACAVSSTSSTCLGGTTFNQSYAYDLHE